MPAPVHNKNQAPLRPPFGTQRPSLHRNVELYCRQEKSPSGRQAMRVIHHPVTKQTELLRVLFSIGVTAFVAAGTFVTIRYLISLSV
jgi:hypothetical protein